MSTPIYHWKLGDVALARVSKKVYAKVQVVKNEDGLFHDEKGMETNESGIMFTSQLCYYVETVCTKQQMWLPYTCLQLAERSRPFYGIDKTVVKHEEPAEVSPPKKRKIKPEPAIPFKVKPSTSSDPDPYVSDESLVSSDESSDESTDESSDESSVDIQEIEETLILKRHTNAFKEFVRLGKDLLFDDLYNALNTAREKNRDILDYLENGDATTEEKFEMVIKKYLMTNNEINNFLCQAWRYRLLHSPRFTISVPPEHANNKKHKYTDFDDSEEGNNTEITDIVEDTNNKEDIAKREDIDNIGDTKNTEDADDAEGANFLKDADIAKDTDTAEDVVIAEDTDFAEDTDIAEYSDIEEYTDDTEDTDNTEDTDYTEDTDNTGDTYTENPGTAEDTDVIEDSDNIEDTDNTVNTDNTGDTDNTVDTDDTDDTISSASSTEDTSESCRESLVQLKLDEAPVITVHAPWCLVCGTADGLWECARCPASFHIACRGEWLVNIRHRKSQVGKKKIDTVASRIRSSSGMWSAREESDGNPAFCPSCVYGPSISFGDIVWHKLGPCSWWPAKVLVPGEIPACLLMMEREDLQLPLRYYGTLNHSWGDTYNMCLFLPKHTVILREEEDLLRKAMLDACDDYIAVYLT